MVSSQGVMDADKIPERLLPITAMNSGKNGVMVGFCDLMLCMGVSLEPVQLKYNSVAGLPAD